MEVDTEHGGEKDDRLEEEDEFGEDLHGLDLSEDESNAKTDEEDGDDLSDERLLQTDEDEREECDEDDELQTDDEPADVDGDNRMAHIQLDNELYQGLNEDRFPVKRRKPDFDAEQMSFPESRPLPLSMPISRSNIFMFAILSEMRQTNSKTTTHRIR
jgi:hypothetical protein